MIELIERSIGLIEQGTLPVMLPLFAVCAGIGFLLIDRTLYLYDPRTLFSFIPPVAAAVQKDRRAMVQALDRYLGSAGAAERREVEAACRRYRTPYSRFILRLLAGSERPGSPLRDLEVECAELEEGLEIERGMAMLSTLARLAPLFGLLGTVTGMIATFSAMMVSSTGDPKALSSGISIALIATLVGLVVSLPGVVGMGVLSKRGHILQSEIRIASMQFRDGRA